MDASIYSHIWPYTATPIYGDIRPIYGYIRIWTYQVIYGPYMGIPYMGQICPIPDVAIYGDFYIGPYIGFL